MKKKNKVIAISIITLIIISNTPPFQFFLQENYHYQNKDGSFQFTEQPGPTQGFNVAIERFADFKLKNPDNQYKILYRTFTFKTWRFWEWYEMVKNSERYKLELLKN